jgi:hypothetical protein
MTGADDTIHKRLSKSFGTDGLQFKNRLTMAPPTLRLITFALASFHNS